MEHGALHLLRIRLVLAVDDDSRQAAPRVEEPEQPVARMAVLHEHGNVGELPCDLIGKRVQRVLHRGLELLVGERRLAPHSPGPPFSGWKPIACSSAWAVSRIAESLKAGPAIWKPTGRSGPPPSGCARPAGIEIAGIPASGIGTVQ